MKFFGLISAGLIASESTPVPFTFDETAELFGPTETAKNKQPVLPTECCTTIKVAGFFKETESWGKFLKKYRRFFSLFLLFFFTIF